MPSYRAYVLSLSLHLAALLVLAAQAPLSSRVEFAVDRGLADAPLSATLPGPSPRVDETPVTVEPIPSDAPLEPVPPEPRPDPTPADVGLDSRAVARPPVEELIQRQSRARAQLSDQLVGERLPVEIGESAPDQTGRELPPLWVPVPDQPAPTRVSVARPIEADPQLERTPAPQVAVADSPAAAVGSDSPAGAQVDELPSHLPNNPEPAYPAELRRQGIGGLVLLNVTIAADGSVAALSVAKSSGQPAFDRSAMETVRTWRFRPARRGTQAVRFDVQLPIRFSVRTSAGLTPGR
jgi:periplasmic protein TonB